MKILIIGGLILVYAAIIVYIIWTRKKDRSEKTNVAYLATENWLDALLKKLFD